MQAGEHWIELLEGGVDAVIEEAWVGFQPNAGLMLTRPWVKMMSAQNWTGFRILMIDDHLFFLWFSGFFLALPSHPSNHLSPWPPGWSHVPVPSQWRSAETRGEGTLDARVPQLTGLLWNLVLLDAGWMIHHGHSGVR